MPKKISADTEKRQTYFCGKSRNEEKSRWGPDGGGAQLGKNKLPSGAKEKKLCNTGTRRQEHNLQGKRERPPPVGMIGRKKWP